jgi:hypothetical protein
MQTHEMGEMGLRPVAVLDIRDHPTMTEDAAH